LRLHIFSAILYSIVVIVTLLQIEGTCT